MIRENGGKAGIPGHPHLPRKSAKGMNLGRNGYFRASAQHRLKIGFLLEYRPGFYRAYRVATRLGAVRP